MTGAVAAPKIVATTLAMSGPEAAPIGDAASAHPMSVRIAGDCESYASRARYHDVRLTDLCRASGASERRVRHAFYECYGVPPTAFLRTAALHEVRRTLLEGPAVRDAVSRAAFDFGFRHLSRFADHYRALFGELPSATVARRMKSGTI
jgi:AraC family ethanolamine operon transcriptional activator